MISIYADKQSLSNKWLLRLSPNDFAPGAFSHVGVDFVSKQSTQESEWASFKPLPGLLCAGRPALCASRMGAQGLESLQSFAATLPVGEVLLSPKMAGRDIAVAAFCLSEGSLRFFEPLLWDALLGIEVGLAIAPKSMPHIVELLGGLPRPFFFRHSVWADFWVGASRSSDLTVMLEDGWQVEIYSSTATPEGLEGSVRGLAKL